MDPIKEAFSRIKQDILLLYQEIQGIKQSIEYLKLQQIPLSLQTIPTQNQTQIPPELDKPTQIPTHQQPFYTENTGFSIGNRGVPTNQQTNQQTDNNPYKFVQSQINIKDDFQHAQQILDSLDSIKKGIRLKFKRLTPQEMLVFSTLYSCEEQGIKEITYKLIANNLNLSESSIRDYVNKLTNKGIPIVKTRLNNKRIALSVSEDLKKIASLTTIASLREL